MNKIYCVYCGKENDINNKKCENCKKEIDPEEHLWKEYFYGKIKGKFKGKVTDKTYSIIINYVKSHLYGFAISFALIATTITGIISITNDHYIQKVKEKPVFISQRQELSLDDPLVKQLYSYQNYNYDLYLNVVYEDTAEALDFYENKLVTYDTLKEEVKLYIAYQNAHLTQIPISIQSCDELKGYNYVHNLCEIEKANGYTDVSIALPFEFYEIDKNLFDKTYYNLFGLDKQIYRSENQVRIARTRACEYNKDTTQYLCYQLPEGWLSMTEEETKLVKAIQNGNKIELYDYFLLVDYNHETPIAYKDRNQTIKITNNFTESSFEQGQLYRHIYKKDTNGNYYWIQSEPVDTLPEM